MPLDDIADMVGGAVIRHAGGLVVDLTVEHVFSGYTARFFHGVGRRTLALVTIGRWRIPSSLRTVPVGARARPRRNDWIALGVGVAIWGALAIAVGLLLARIL